jgi:hypothetical protein
MDSAQLPSPQIGRILIAAGLLSEAQLADALEEQRQTGRRLGEIIVRRGFISGPALANALAEQHGGLLKTEYGFATGLGGQAAQKAASEAAAEAIVGGPMPLLRTADPEPAPVSQLRTADLPPEPAAEPEPEPEPEPVPIPHQPVAVATVLEAEPAPEPEIAIPHQPVPVVVVPEPQPQPAAQPQPAPEPVLEPEPDPEPVAIVPDERDALIESLRARVDAQGAELAKLRQELAEAKAAREALEVAPASPPLEPASAPAQQEHYLVCVPTSAGYVLLDRIGAVPTVGQSVDVPEEDGRFTVTKVVRLPRNGRPCAYLQRL